jgi:hypothetical protein
MCSPRHDGPVVHRHGSTLEAPGSTREGAAARDREPSAGVGTSRVALTRFVDVWWARLMPSSLLLLSSSEGSIARVNSKRE